MSKVAALAAEFPVYVGRRIELEGRRWPETVMPSEWEGAPFRITTAMRAWPELYTPTASGYVELACRIEVTGRTVRYWRGGRAVRVKVTFIHENEPNSTVGGWMFV